MKYIILKSYNYILYIIYIYIYYIYRERGRGRGRERDQDQLKSTYYRKDIHFSTLYYEHAPMLW